MSACVGACGEGEGVCACTCISNQGLPLTKLLRGRHSVWHQTRNVAGTHVKIC